MASLQQILSAMLRDVAKSRFSSDLYSRTIARYYENDYLLRKFPIPRTDIDEVEIGLKFGIDELEANDLNGEGKEANLAFVLERTTEQLVSTFLDLALAFCEDEQNRETTTHIEQAMTLGFHSASLRIELRQYLLRYLIESYPHLIDHQGRFDSEAAHRNIRRPLMLALYQFTPPDKALSVDAFNKTLTPLLDSVLNNDAFNHKLAALAEPVQTIWDGNNDIHLEILVNHDHLQHLPEEALSSVRIKASVRNHVWTEVKTGEYSSHRELTSE